MDNADASKLFGFEFQKLLGSLLTAGGALLRHN